MAEYTTGDVLEEAPPAAIGAVLPDVPAAIAPTKPLGAKAVTLPKAAAPVYEPWEPSEAESRAAAAAKGLAGPILGVAQLAGRGQRALASGFGMLPNPVSEAFSPAIDAVDARIKALNDAGRAFKSENSPKTEFAASMISPPNVLGGRVAGAVGASPLTQAILGGAMAGGSNPIEDVQNYWNHKLTDISVAGAISGGLHGVGKGLGAVISPVLQKAVKVLQDHGVDTSKLTLGQLLGGGARKFEDWLRDVVPMNNITAAQGRGEKEFMVAPVREAMKNVGAKVEATADMPKILAAAQKDIGNAYSDAVASAPSIGMKAVPNAAGTGYKMNTGSPAIFGRIMKDAEKWRKVPNGMQQANTEGDQAYVNLSRAIQEHALKPFKPNAQGAQYSYADPKQLHKSIKDLNSAIDDQYKKLTAGTGNPYTREYVESLEKVRDHMRGLWEKADAGSFGKLRGADAAHSGVSTVQKASSAAAKAKGEFTPEQLIAAGTKGSGVRSTAAGQNRLQAYGSAAQDVFGGPPANPPHGLEALIEKTMLLPAAPIVNSLYGPGAQGALAKWATNQSPVRRGVGEFAREAPRYLGGLSAGVAGSPVVQKTLTGQTEN